MKSFELLPTNMNIIETYLKNPINRSESVNLFVNMLFAVEGGCSIAVDSSWGSGKTFFVKQSKLILDSINPDNPFSKTKDGIRVKENLDKHNVFNNSEIRPFLTAYYDAWEHDDEVDPLLSIVYELIQSNQFVTKIQNDVDYVSILTSFVDMVSSKNISSFINSLKGKNVLELPNRNQELRNTINTFFDSLLKETGYKLVVFIDELDRCSPVFAIKLLERIKHYFFHDSIVFVFSINQIELQKTIRTFYGEQFDACRYLDRFFDYRIGLPDVNISSYMEAIGISDMRNLRDTVCKECVKQMKLSLREITKYLTATKMATFKAVDAENAETIRCSQFDGGFTLMIAFSVIVPIAIALRIYDLDSYYNFVNGYEDRWLQDIVLSDQLKNWILPHLESKYQKSSEVFSGVFDKEKALIDDFYEAIFIVDYENSDVFHKEVGKLHIDANTKKVILDAVNMSSKYTNWMLEKHN